METLCPKCQHSASLFLPHFPPCSQGEVPFRIQSSEYLSHSHTIEAASFSAASGKVQCSGPIPTFHNPPSRCANLNQECEGTSEDVPPVERRAENSSR
eukprot:344000-Rhodomonas_salina.1